MPKPNRKNPIRTISEKSAQVCLSVRSAVQTDFAAMRDKSRKKEERQIKQE